MSISRRDLYAAGEPFGASCTRMEGGRRICGGGGGDDQQSTTTRSIPDELKGAATSYSKMVTDLANTPYQAYTGQGVADLNPYQMGAMGLIGQKAMDGGVQSASEGALKSMLAGGNTNPYLDQMVQKAQDSVKSNFNTSAVNSGSFGNSGLQQQYASGLTDVATQMYGNAYNTNQQNIVNALGLQSGVQNSAYTGANQLMNAGNTAYNNSQDKADFAYQQHQNKTNYPLQQISAVGGGINNMAGSSTTSSGGGGK